MATEKAQLTMSQAARKLGLSSSWLGRLVDSGRIAATTTPYGRLIDADELDRYAASREDA